MSNGSELSGGGDKGGDVRWAHFRFGGIGPLRAAPPERGELKGELKGLAWVSLL